MYLPSLIFFAQGPEAEHILNLDAFTILKT